MSTKTYLCKNITPLGVVDERTAEISDQHDDLDQYDGMVPCIDKAALTVCCPVPVDDSSDTYLSYRISDPQDFKEYVFSQIVSDVDAIDPNRTYRIKAMQDYRGIYFTLLDALEQCETCKDSKCAIHGVDECSLYCSGEEQNITDDIRNTIESKSLELLTCILGKEWSKEGSKEISQQDLHRKYRCVLRQTIEDDGQAIYIMLLGNPTKGTTGKTSERRSRKKVRSLKKDEKRIKVCLSYAWSDDSYFKEVQMFADKLGDMLGPNFEVDYDRRDGPPNDSWSHKTTELLKDGRVFVVLLSREYKEKADNPDSSSGVRDEVDVLVEYLKKKYSDKDVLLARLPSQREFDRSDLMPLNFANKKNINDLSKEEPLSGHGYKALVNQIQDVI